MHQWLIPMRFYYWFKLLRRQEDNYMELEKNLWITCKDQTKPEWVENWVLLWLSTISDHVYPKLCWVLGSECFFKLQQGASISRFVGRSVGRSVCPSVKKNFTPWKWPFWANLRKWKLLRNMIGLYINSQPPNHPPTQPPPAHPSTQRDKYVRDRIQFRRENKSFLTQCVDLKNILKLNPNSI